MKIFCFLFSLIFSLTCLAWQIDSSYTIVLPQKAANRKVEKALQAGAENLQYALNKVGIKVRIKKSSIATPGNKSIFIGFKDNKKRTHYNGSIKIKNRDIYLTGNDIQCIGKPIYSNNTSFVYIGSLTALVTFMENYLNCPIVLPCKESLQIENLPQLPENLDIEVKAPLEFASGFWSPMLLFDYANSNFGRGNTFVYGGHSHPAAIPQKIYGKSNPEYFSLVKGKRTNNKHFHGHCLSNPKVEELIYQEALEQLDKGFDMVEIGQSDGNVPCECQNCLSMPGGKDAGERLWQFHLKLAKRLEKDRPGKKLLIICYWPNLNPPKNCKKLPANVTIELTSYGNSHLNKWKNYDVPGGFYCYIYNWGYYHPEGFTPKNCDPQFLEKQVKDFQKFGIKGLYRCGYLDLPGLEGPAYYIYGQLWRRKNVTGNELLNEYCHKVFGKAAPIMLKFYKLLYSRQNCNILPVEETRWSHLIKYKRKIGDLEANQALFAKRYPQEIIAQLDNLLKAAYQNNPTLAALWIKPYIDREFNYLKTTAQIANCMAKLASSNDKVIGNQLLTLIAKRNKASKELSQNPQLKNKYSLIKSGGSMYGSLSFPYHIDAEYLLRNKVSLCQRTIKIGDKPQLLIKEKGRKHPVKLAVNSDSKNLYIQFIYPEYSTKQLGEDKLNLYLQDSKGQILKFQKWLKSKTPVYTYKLLKTSTQNNGKIEEIQRFTTNNIKFTLKDSKENFAIAEFVIPYEVLGGKPSAKTKRLFNASCLRYLPNNSKVQDGIAFWEINFGKLNWRQDMDRYGIIEF
jgi:hypothetical protein